MNFSRETRDKLDVYLALLKKWNPKINLVSPATLQDASVRHFDDSLQVCDLASRDATTWVDLGSGGGFPGAVVALAKPNVTVTLIESDQRKAAFLRTVSRETKTPFFVIADRIENVAPLNTDILSARALAPLVKLLEFAALHLSSNGTALFMKGETWQDEVHDAQKMWRFTWEAHKSVTSPTAVILEIGDISRA